MAYGLRFGEQIQYGSNVGPEAVRPLPLTADLNISEKKTRGEARKDNAKVGDEKRLISEAVAQALGHQPPKAEAADVLVAMNIYKQQVGDKLTIIVTGYPAGNLIGQPRVVFCQSVIFLKYTVGIYRYQLVIRIRAFFKRNESVMVILYTIVC